MVKIIYFLLVFIFNKFPFLFWKEKGFRFLLFNPPSPATLPTPGWSARLSPATPGLLRFLLDELQLGLLQGDFLPPPLAAPPDWRGEPEGGEGQSGLVLRLGLADDQGGDLGSLLLDLRQREPALPSGLLESGCPEELSDAKIINECRR